MQHPTNTCSLSLFFVGSGLLLNVIRRLLSHGLIQGVTTDTEVVSVRNLFRLIKTLQYYFVTCFPSFLQNNRTNVAPPRLRAKRERQRCVVPYTNSRLERQGRHNTQRSKTQLRLTYFHRCQRPRIGLCFIDELVNWTINSRKGKGHMRIKS